MGVAHVLVHATELLIKLRRPHGLFHLAERTDASDRLSDARGATGIDKIGGRRSTEIEDSLLDDFLLLRRSCIPSHGYVRSVA